MWHQQVAEQELSITSPRSHWFWQDWFCSRMISHLRESSKELIHRTQLEQNRPRVDTSRSVRRRVLHHLPHPPHGENLSANRNILLMIPTEEERMEQCVHNPCVDLIKRPSFFPTQQSHLDWVEGEVEHKEEKSQAK
jgi:hypothetical protein